MTRKLEIKFDGNLDYQLAAIQAVVDLFDGVSPYFTQQAWGEGVVANLPDGHTISPGVLFDNLVHIQQRNRIPQNAALELDDGLVLEGAGYESWQHPGFTIEMETGTGKTYVYLRTIYELRQKYGFSKFIIVVPSIAIYEGVIKHFQITRTHFAGLYHNEPVNLIRYDGGKLSNLRSFAQDNSVQILVMTIQSFNTAAGRSTNRIFRPSEQLPGERKPYQYVQATRPILILDEPQNFGSDLSKEALRTLHPLVSLRYSATHREAPNLLFRLTPFEAFQRGFVKRIQVDAVTERQNLNAQMIVLQEIKRNPFRAVVRTLVNRDGRTEEEELELKDGDDLYLKTRREEHRNGYVVTEISLVRNEGFVEFENQTRLTLHDVFGHNKRAIFRTQIERTVERHMAVQQRLADQDIKVLSLFFIDRVANYVEDDGLIRVLFEEAFERTKQDFPFFKDKQVQDVHSGYFSKRKRTGTDEEEAFDTEGRNQKERDAERQAFELIMREKEKLLSFDEDVSFIFAHSALKEGWDNPNVFQICTLNQTNAEMKKRQEIGRGLRLPVDQNGERIFDDRVNILTVVANESYDRYAANLQREYRDAGMTTEAPPKPTKADQATVHRNPAVFTHRQFRDFWDKLCRVTKYRIHIDSDQLIEECALKFNSLDDERFEPRIVIETGGYIMTKYKLTLEKVFLGGAQIKLEKFSSEGEHMNDMVLRSYQVGSNLATLNHDDRLRGFIISEIHDHGDHSAVKFRNDITLQVGEYFEFESEQGQAPATRVVKADEQTYPVFNLIDRAAKATGLTRKTINRIFKAIDPKKQSYIFRNPEGFANIFIDTINEQSADHLVENIEFVVDPMNKEYFDLEDLFPEKREFAQKELIDAGEAGMYDKVQIDSDVERRFVTTHLTGNDPKVIAYFKFPPSYRIPFPRIIGNYNPDWGILRYDNQDRVVLQLVRETKSDDFAKAFRDVNTRLKRASSSRPKWAIENATLGCEILLRL
jgi:type III restriction enzyme